MKSIAWPIAAMGIALMASGCKKEATGQVVAVVNGEEISQSELNSEIQTLQAPPGTNPTLVRQAALQRLVDRKLIVQAAHEQKLDQDPEYLKRRRRGEEELLTSMLGQQMMGTIKPPSQSAIAEEIAKNPQIFAQRTIFQVDQLRFPAPADTTQLNQLRPAHTMEEVRVILDRMGIKYTSGQGQIDSATVPPDLIAQIVKLPPREPLVLVNNGNVFVNDIINRQIVPMPEREAHRIAVEMLRREQFGQLTDKRLQALRASAKIDYQTGFAPPPGGLKALAQGSGAKPAPGGGVPMGTTLPAGPDGGSNSSGDVK